MKIAIVGTGIAGNAAAWALCRDHDITVYEREFRPGGHSHTVDIDYDGRSIAVDTGFIVYNELNYPDLTGLFDHLGVETVASDMSFSVSADGGAFEWAGRGHTPMSAADALFAQRRNALSPAFWRMLAEVLRFNRAAIADRTAGTIGRQTLGDYLAAGGYSRRLARDYLLPMGAAIWSTPAEDMLDFPAENFIAFFDNHRLLHPDRQRPVWRTVRGGSREYVTKLTAPFRHRLRLGRGVARIARLRNGVAVIDTSGERAVFDQVVVAAHSDQALAMLADPTEAERAVLGAIRYRPNRVYLHRDPSLMPRRRRAWSSWNFLRSSDLTSDNRDVAVTYWMNALQHIDPERPLFVSLNPPCAPDPALTFAEFTCDHPQFDAAAFAAQRRLEDIQGVRRLWFCGAWTGYGFHEDGLRSGLAVAEALGGSVPWRAAAPRLAEAAE